MATWEGVVVDDGMVPSSVLAVRGIDGEDRNRLRSIAAQAPVHLIALILQLLEHIAKPLNVVPMGLGSDGVDPVHYLLRLKPIALGKPLEVVRVPEVVHDC